MWLASMAIKTWRSKPFAAAAPQDKLGRFE
jgi:hypothetical protein